MIFLLLLNSLIDFSSTFRLGCALMAHLTSRGGPDRDSLVIRGSARPILSRDVDLTTVDENHVSSRIGRIGVRSNFPLKLIVTIFVSSNFSRQNVLLKSATFKQPTIFAMTMYILSYILVEILCLVLKKKKIVQKYALVMK